MTEEEFRAELLDLLAHLGKVLPVLPDEDGEKIRAGMDAVRRYLKEGLID